MRQKLSVIIITKNEAANLRRCLQSVAWADEIIIVDSGSTDATLAIAQEFTPHIYHVAWPGFGKQKNNALDKASHPWILSLDADEQVTPALKEKILQLLGSEPSFRGYCIRRESQYCGKWVHYGDWRSDYVTRLWHREAGRFDDKPIHERLIINGEIGTISEPIRHYTSPTLENSINKMNLYSTLGAEQLFAKGKRSSLLKAILKSKWCFFRGYILRGGFLDGWQGFLLAVANAQGTYYKYVKLKVLWHYKNTQPKD